MSAAPGRPKQAKLPLGGARGHAVSRKGVA
jgi:hypothetical protein